MHRELYKRKATEHERCDPMDFSVIETEEQAYVLGFLSADGHVSSKTNTIQVILAMKDLAHIWKLNYLLTGCSVKIDKSVRTKPDYPGKIYEQCRLRIRSETMAKQLLGHGLTPRKSLTLRPPKRLRKDLVRHWIRGYFDGDGCVSGSVIKKKKWYVRAHVLGTKQVCNFINETFRGIYAHGCHLYRHDKLFVAGYGSYTAQAFLDWIYRDAKIFLDRKYILAEKYLYSGLITDGCTITSPSQVNLALRFKQKNRSGIWEDWEDLLIRRIYLSQNKEDLKTALSHRNWKQIRDRANYLGLRATNRKDGWTSEETEWLKMHRDSLPMKEITTRLRKTHHTVYRKLRKLDEFEEAA